MLRVSLAALSLSAAAGLPASAQETIIDYHIPRGTLGSVVNAIAAAGGRSIAFPSGLASGRQAGPITGRKTVSAALNEALAGSGLTINESGGALTVVRARQEGVNANSATDVLDIDVVGTKTGDQGFLAGETASSTRIEGTIQETPLSITGVTKDVITTQAATSAVDAAQNVSGVAVTPPSGNGAISPTYSIRGVATSNILIQGQPASPTGTDIPITDIERVDVIKGPTSILTGVGGVGGAINLITKQPTSTPIREMSVYLGSFGYKTLAFDLGGPVPQTEGLTYRLNFSGNIADQNYGGYPNPHEYLFSPVVRWEDAVTSVQAGFRLVQTKVDPLPYSFLLSSAADALPYRIGRTTILGNRDDHANAYTYQPYFSAQRILGTSDLGWWGTAEYTVHTRTQYTKSIQDFSSYAPAVIIPSANFFVLGGSASRVNSDLATNAEDLTIKHTTRYVDQTIRLGFDELYSHGQTFGSFQYGSPSIATAFGPGTNFPAALLNAPYVPLQQSTIPNTLIKNDAGVSFQDNIDIVDRLHILGVVREDFYNSTTNTYQYGASTHVNSQQDALSYQAGAAFDVFTWLTVYGSDGTGFNPQTAVLANGSAPPPQLTTNDEAGIKLALLDKKLSVTGALYHLSFSNTIYSTPIGNAVGPGYESRGVETDVQGQITPNLQAIASFSFNRYNQPPITEAAGVAVQPNRVPGVPDITASAFLNYTFLDGPLHGLSLGAGGHGNGVSYLSGSTAQTWRLPGYAVADVYAGFHHDGYDINFKLNNVFNKYYYLPSFNTVYIPIGEGRSFSLVIKRQF